MLTYRRSNGINVVLPEFKLDTLLVNGQTLDNVVNEYANGSTITLKFTQNIDASRSNLLPTLNNTSMFTVDGYDVIIADGFGDTILLFVRPQPGSPSSPPVGTTVTLNQPIYDVNGSSITSLTTSTSTNITLTGSSNQSLAQGASLTPVSMTLQSNVSFTNLKNLLSLTDNSANDVALGTIFESITVTVGSQSYTLTPTDLSTNHLSIGPQFNLDANVTTNITVSGKLKSNAPLGHYNFNYGVQEHSSVGYYSVLSSLISVNIQ